MVSAVAVRYNTDEFKRPRTPSFIADSANALEMQPGPIEPSWVIDGNPQARSAFHSRAEDESGLTSVWDCTAGSFRWFFGWDETVMILEGEVLVKAEDGTQRLLRAGDIAYFKGGSWATWHVETYVRKIAFLRRPAPAPLAVLYRLRNRLRRSRPVGLAG
nr:cupin domain-containing protein [Neorhizobium lilium]